MAGNLEGGQSGDLPQLISTYNHPEALRQGLDHLERAASSTGPRVPNADYGNCQVELRLFVVEDLSREVIEQPGYCYNVDPEFFLAHLSNHIWYKIRDPLWNPPGQNVDTARRDWYSLCFSRARYFPSHRLFNQDQQAFGLSDVDRRMYLDENKVIRDTDWNLTGRRTEVPVVVAVPSRRQKERDLGRSWRRQRRIFRASGA